MQRCAIGVGVLLHLRLCRTAGSHYLERRRSGEVEWTGIDSRRCRWGGAVGGVVDHGIAATAYSLDGDVDTCDRILEGSARRNDQTRSNICRRIGPDGIAVSGCHLAIAAEGTTGLVAQTEDQITVLTLDSSLITTLLCLFVADGTLRVHTGQVAGIDHRLEVLLVFIPVRIEHAGYARHREHERIGLHQTILQFRLHRVAVAAELLSVAAQEPVVAVDKRNGILAVAAAQQTATLAATIVEACNAVERAILGLEIQRHHIAVGLLDTTDDLIVARPIFHEGDIGMGCLVVVVHVPVVETVTLVVAPAVVLHHVAHPLQIGLEHLLHIDLVVTPVACSVPVSTVVG